MKISLFEWEENTVVKGENAGYKQFLLFPQCFQKLSVVDVSIEYLWSKGLAPYQKNKILDLKAFPHNNIHGTQKLNIVLK